MIYQLLIIVKHKKSQVFLYTGVPSDYEAGLCITTIVRIYIIIPESSEAVSTVSARRLSCYIHMVPVSVKIYHIPCMSITHTIAKLIPIACRKCLKLLLQICFGYDQIIRRGYLNILWISLDNTHMTIGHIFNDYRIIRYLVFIRAVVLNGLVE